MGKLFLCSTPNQEHLQIKKNMWTMDIIYIIIKKYFESNILLYIKQIQLSVFVLVKRGTESLIVDEKGCERILPCKIVK